MKQNYARRIRFSDVLLKQIASSASHLRGNFSAQVKYLLSVAIEKKGESLSPEKATEIINQMSKVSSDLAQVGNNLNQIAYYLNASPDAGFEGLAEAHTALEKEQSKLRKFLNEIRVYYI
jgi:hypothetical protein